MSILSYKSKNFRYEIQLLISPDISNITEQSICDVTDRILWSAYLARAGFTGATKILEGEKGFCRAMVTEPHLEKLTDGLNDGIYKIDNNSFKPYACCKHSHAALYAMQVLRTEHGLKPDDVEAIEILVNEITDFLINNPQPENPYGCKFSIQYCVAGMLKYGDMGVDRFLTEVIGDAEVRSLMAKTKVMRDAAIEAYFQTNRT